MHKWIKDFHYYYLNHPMFLEMPHIVCMNIKIYIYIFIFINDHSILKLIYIEYDILENTHIAHNSKISFYLN